MAEDYRDHMPCPGSPLEQANAKLTEILKKTMVLSPAGEELVKLARILRNAPPGSIGRKVMARNIYNTVYATSPDTLGADGSAAQEAAGELIVAAVLIVFPSVSP